METLCEGLMRHQARSKDEVWSRWTEHFEEVLNREEPENSIADDEECEFNDMVEEIAVNEPTMAEIKAVIKRLQNRKATGLNSTTTELPRADEEFTAKKIHQLLKKAWKHETFPKSWK